MFSQNTREQTALKWSLIVGIVVLLNLFFNYAVSVIYDTPKYEDFCPYNRIAEVITTEEQCTDVGGQWFIDQYPKPVVYDQTGAQVPQPIGSCNPDYTCAKEFETVSNTYNKNVFIILVVLGVASLAFGTLVKTSQAVTTGFALGGVLSLVIASIRYWSTADDIVKLVILAVGLGVLVWLGIKRFKD